MFITNAYAQEAMTATQAGLAGYLPFIVIIAVFYFLIIRPQNKRMQEHQQMVAELKKGDYIVTSGGIQGEITQVIDDTTVEVEVAKDVKVLVSKFSVSALKDKPKVKKAAAPKAKAKTAKKPATAKKAGTKKKTTKKAS